MTEKDMIGTITHTSQVAHITLCITEDDRGHYRIYSWAKKDVVSSHLLADFSEATSNYREAINALHGVEASLCQVLERKRLEVPTPKQLHFLFTSSIPIPLMLTWGEASDLINGYIEKQKQERIQAQTKRFRGFIVGMRVIVFPDEWFAMEATITKLTTNNQGIVYAYVSCDKDPHNFGIDLPDAFRINVKEIQKK